MLDNFKDFRSREKHPSWKGGRLITIQGYVKISMPEHPYCDCKGYILEHRVVMEKHLGRLLDRKEIVHHINRVRDDNRLENLELVENNKEHGKLHASLFIKKDYGKCIICNEMEVSLISSQKCKRCYYYFKRHGVERPNPLVYRKYTKFCLCGNPYYAKDLCKKCYKYKLWINRKSLKNN